MRSIRTLALLGFSALVASGCGAVDGIREAADDFSNAAENAEEAQKQWEARNEKRRAATFTVTYTTGDEGEFTYAQDPPRAVYLNDDLLILHEQGTVTTCHNLDDDPTCVESEVGDSDDFYGLYGTQFFAGFADLFAGLPGLDSEESTATIAGRDAECTTVDLSEVFGISTGSDGTVTTCYDKQTGVVLRAETVDGDGKTESSIEATEFSDKVDSSLFKLPAKAKSTDDIKKELEEELEKLSTTTTSRR